MTADRRKHPREPVDWGDPAGRRQRRREPAEAHFRHLRGPGDTPAVLPEAAGEG